VLRDEGHAYMLWEAGAGAEHTRVVDVHVALPAYVAKSGGVLADHAFGSGGEVGALERVDWLRLALPGRGGGIVDYRLVLKGLWSADDLRDLRARGRAPAGLATAREWVSETPVVLHRHPKVRRGQFVKDGPVQQVHAYLQRAGFPAAEVELVEDRPRWVKFRRQRRRGAGGVGAWGFRLTFAEPVSGPIAVGALAHFGLGRFRPA
jgi:CRISPR-associated protein Csb2